MIYLVEPMNMNTSSECPPVCACNECHGVMTSTCPPNIVCSCEGGREGCCGLGGRTPEHRVYPID